MKKSKYYIKNFLKVIIWPIILLIGQIFINYIFVAIFNSKEKGNMSDSEFINHIKTIEYQDKLNNYINSKALIIMTILIIILVPIFYTAYKKYKVKNNFKLNNIFIPILFGVSISLIYNILIFNLNNLIYFTNKFDGSSIGIITQLITSGICGPILEELVFRGLVYNKLKTFNKPMTSIILTSLIFALFHNNIIDMIYAFGVSFMFIYLYQKYKTLKAPIIMHMSLNITIILMSGLIVKNYLAFNLYLLVVSVLVLLYLKKFIKKDV